MPAFQAAELAASLALGIGALHMLAPDHWVPLALYCHAKGITTRRSAAIAAAGGLAHVAGSLLAMLLAIGAGLAIAGSFSSLSNYIIGISFIVIAGWMAFRGLRAPGVEGGPVDTSRGTKWLVFATASSPELTIFPVYLAASVNGPGTVTIALVAFTIGTVVSIVSVTLAGIKGAGRFLNAPGREREIDYLIAAILLFVGFGVIILG